MATITKKNFIDLIQTYVPLEEHGAISSGYCPFCFDDEETFFAYPDAQKWHCFNCQKKGNIYEFIEQREHLSAQEAEHFIDCFIHSSQDKEEKLTKIIDSSNSETKDSLKTEVTVLNKKNFEDKTKGSNKEVHISELEIAITEPEIIISEPEVTISEADDIGALKKLLGSFHECTDCQGIAIIHVKNNKLIGSSIDDFDEKNIQALNAFVLSTLKLTRDILGDFDNESTKLIFRMNVIIKSVQKKLIWVPMLSKGQHKYNLLMLLDNKTSEKMLLIKLKNRLAKIDV